MLCDTSHAKRQLLGGLSPESGGSKPQFNGTNRYSMTRQVRPYKSGNVVIRRQTGQAVLQNMRSGDVSSTLVSPRGLNPPRTVSKNKMHGDTDTNTDNANNLNYRSYNKSNTVAQKYR